MVYNELPWDDDSEIVLFEKIKNDPLQFKQTRKVSNGLQQLMSSMLEKDCRKRATLDQLL
jgi:serine/threonine protein kinase